MLINQPHSALSKDLPSWNLTQRQLCDVEMILQGAFAPLQGFLNQADYQRVLAEMRLTSGEFYPMPVTLDVSESFAETLVLGQHIILRDAEYVAIALMTVESLWQADKVAEVEQIYATQDSTCLLYTSPSPRDPE